tara:strand:+ start:8764 stop:9078 length:315 start_codon:yes stop_codon:yes gene_type:complete
MAEFIMSYIAMGGPLHGKMITVRLQNADDKPPPYYHYGEFKHLPTFSGGAVPNPEALDAEVHVYKAVRWDNGPDQAAGWWRYKHLTPTEAAADATAPELPSAAQ